MGLAVALLGEPRLIILDEPTSALDPVGRDDVRAIIRAARARGAAVILNSHLLGEVERVCDEVVIVHRGRAIAHGGLRTLLGEPSLRLSVSGLADPLAVVGRFAPVIVEPDEPPAPSHRARAHAGRGARRWSRRAAGSTGSRPSSARWRTCSWSWCGRA